MKDLFVPQGMSFLKLKLNKKNGQYIYNRKQIKKLCLLNGFNNNKLKKIQITEAMLIIFLYFKHLESGGEPHIIAEELAEYVNEHVGFYKKPSYKPLKYKAGYRDINNDLLKYHTDGHHHIQQMSPEKYQVFGVVFTIILLLEFKLDNLLIKFDSQIKDKTLGSKIRVFNDFLSIFETADGEDKQEYYEIIPPLEELNRFRNKIAHKLTDINFKITNIPLIQNYMLENSWNHEEVKANSEGETAKFIVSITLFSLKLSELLAHLRMQIE